MKHFVLIALLVCTSEASAQTEQPPANPMVAALGRAFAGVSGFILASAEQFPEDKYGYKPTADVRSFGDEIAHVTDAHFMLCSRAKNEASPATARVEGNVKTKAELITKYKESVAYCKGAYDNMTDAMLSQPFQQGQSRGVRLGPLAGNTAHDNEHYGKIVTMYRLNGMVPPSSQPRQ